MDDDAVITNMFTVADSYLENHSSGDAMRFSTI